MENLLKKDYEKGHSLKFLKEKYKRKKEEIVILIGLSEEYDDDKHSRMTRNLATKGYKSFCDFIDKEGLKTAKQYAKTFYTDIP